MHRFTFTTVILLGFAVAVPAQQRHWAYVAPRRPALPSVRNSGWARTPIDRFILARLEREGLKPAPDADKITLLRRVSLDLAGLPPTPAEVDAFLADRDSDAYERAVDRLLASPRFGERMAHRWLDAARYADTNGYQSDGERIMWRWRDWVINAYNANMPFDRFTIEQLAGDLVPGATLDQRIATGFNRNHRGNGEGGVIPEEYAVEYVADRVDTTATVWMGLTFGCVRCHDHKYDPFKQKEYYQLFAYFNQVPEHGRAIKYGNSPPFIPTPTRDQQERLRQLDTEIGTALLAIRALEPEIGRMQLEWERSILDAVPRRWTPTRHQQAHLPLYAKGRFRDGAPAFVPGVVGLAASFDGKRFIDMGDVANFGFYDKFTLSAWIYAGSEMGAILSRTPETPRADGIDVRLHQGKIQFNLVKRWLDDALRVETAAKIALNKWTHIAVTYDGSRLATGVRICIDGRPVEITVLLDELNQSFATKEPLRVGSGGGPDSRFRGHIDDVRVFSTALSFEELAWLADAELIQRAAETGLSARTIAQVEKLRACFLDTAAPPAIRAAYRRVVDLREQRQKLIESFPTTMVMEDMAKPRDTFVLTRGEYDKRGEKVSPSVPEALRDASRAQKVNRLEMAQWLVSNEHPLTARVAVNRLWQMLFGAGIVKTVDDFGVRGERPSHPELLDWLATEFIRSGWDTKTMLRLMVTSATYRQSSAISDFGFRNADSSMNPHSVDSDNRLLSRGPRLRLSAEAIRDQALFASGLLVNRVGGPSVKPYQPAGLGNELGADPYVQDRGEDLYRRSLYTFWKRTVAPPNMMAFDAAGRETCVVRESRTNTPLQALTLLNDVTFVEAARVLAQRVMREANSPEARLRLAFRTFVARTPTDAELQVLIAGLKAHLDDFKRNSKVAEKFLAQGESPRPANIESAELAAYTAMVSIILNLDETITKD
jgi:hypothetical protein